MQCIKSDDWIIRWCLHRTVKCFRAIISINILQLYLLISFTNEMLNWNNIFLHRLFLRFKLKRSSTLNKCEIHGKIQKIHALIFFISDYEPVKEFPLNVLGLRKKCCLWLPERKRFAGWIRITSVNGKCGWLKSISLTRVNESSNAPLVTHLSA